MKVVAEGIETMSLWERMRDAGCDIGQGIFIAPALGIEQLLTGIDEWDTFTEWPKSKLVGAN
jgi:EAL domain-containing protein (putative c-di-GMP-specific phosphodiesterase class I)